MITPESLAEIEARLAEPLWHPLSRDQVAGLLAEVRRLQDERDEALRRRDVRRRDGGPQDDLLSHAPTHLVSGECQCECLRCWRDDRCVCPDCTEAQLHDHPVRAALEDSRD